MACAIWGAGAGADADAGADAGALAGVLAGVLAGLGRSAEEKARMNETVALAKAVGPFSDLMADDSQEVLGTPRRTLRSAAHGAPRRAPINAALNIVQLDA